MQAGNRSTSPPKGGMGIGRVGTSSPRQEGSMQSPRMKVSQRTSAPKPTGSGQGMGEIGLMEKSLVKRLIKLQKAHKKGHVKKRGA